MRGAGGGCGRVDPTRVRRDGDIIATSSPAISALSKQRRHRHIYHAPPCIAGVWTGGARGGDGSTTCVGPPAHITILSIANHHHRTTAAPPPHRHRRTATAALRALSHGYTHHVPKVGRHRRQGVSRRARARVASYHDVACVGAEVIRQSTRCRRWRGPPALFRGGPGDRQCQSGQAEECTRHL